MAEKQVEQATKVAGKMESERIVVLSDGTEVKCVSVSPLLIQEVTMRHSGPDAPTKTIQTAGGLEETYIDYKDEGYLRDTEKAELAQRLASTDALLLMGLPDVQEPKSKAWAENLEVLGLDIPDKGPRRRLAFIKFSLLRRTTDLTMVVTALTEISGATKEMVAEAEASFPSSSAGDR